MNRQTSDAIISFGTLIIAMLFIDIYWLFRDYWYHWFGLIGYLMMGWWWRQ